MKKTEMLANSSPALSRDQLRTVFKPILEGRVSQDTMSKAGCIIFPTKILLILKGQGDLVRKLNSYELDHMKEIAKILINDDLWNQLDPYAQQKLRYELSMFFQRMVMNSFKTK